MDQGRRRRRKLTATALKYWSVHVAVQFYRVCSALMHAQVRNERPLDRLVSLGEKIENPTIDVFTIRCLALLHIQKFFLIVATC